MGFRGQERKTHPADRQKDQKGIPFWSFWLPLSNGFFFPAPENPFKVT